MEKVFLNFNEDEYNLRIESYSPYLNSMNEILNMYDALKLPTLNAQEFIELIHNTNSVFYDKMSDNKPVVIGGFTLNKAKAFELFDKPNGYEAIVKAIDNYKKMLSWNGYLSKINIEANKVIISSSVLESEKEAATVFATNEEQLKAFRYAEALIKLTEETFGKPNQDISATVNSLITFSKNYNSPGGEYKINYKNIRGVGVVA